MTPRQEGTNSLIDRTTVAFIYSAKALPSDIPIIRVFDLNRATIEQARQQSDVIQFCFRGAIRDSEWSGTYRIYLYDKTQADALAAYIRMHEIAEVELIPNDEAGIMDVPGSKSGRRAP